MFQRAHRSTSFRGDGERRGVWTARSFRSRSASFASHSLLNSGVEHPGHGWKLLSLMTSFCPLHTSQSLVSTDCTDLDGCGSTAARDSWWNWRARLIRNPLGLRMLLRKCGRTSATNSESGTPRSSSVSRMIRRVCSAKTCPLLRASAINSVSGQEYTGFSLRTLV